MIAQSVEHAAVTRGVVGSSPTQGAGPKARATGKKEKRAAPHRQADKTSPFHGGNTSSNLVGVIRKFADVAQLAEQLICNQQVIGSSPIICFFLLSTHLGPVAQLVRATR